MILKRNEFLIFLLPTIICLLIVIIVPMIYSLAISFTNYNLIFPEQTRFIGLNNFERLIFDYRFLHSLEFTFIFTATAVGLECFIGLGLALLVNQKQIRGKRVIIILMILPIVMSPVIVGHIWKFLLSYDYGAINYLGATLNIFEPQGWLSNPSLTLFSILIVDIWQWAPFMFLIIFACLRGISRQVHDAADIDGASRWQHFRYVTLPLLKGGIIIATILRSIDALKIFDTIFVLTKGGPGIISESTSIYTYYTNFRFFNMGYASAASWFFLIIIIVIFTIYIKILPPVKRRYS